MSEAALAHAAGAMNTRKPPKTVLLPRQGGGTIAGFAAHRPNRPETRTRQGGGGNSAPVVFLPARHIARLICPGSLGGRFRRLPRHTLTRLATVI
jgi:hypothetical protein